MAKLFCAHSAKAAATFPARMTDPIVIIENLSKLYQQGEVDTEVDRRLEAELQVADDPHDGGDHQAAEPRQETPSLPVGHW